MLGRTSSSITFAVIPPITVRGTYISIQRIKTNNNDVNGTTAVESLLQAIALGTDHTIKSKNGNKRHDTTTLRAQCFPPRYL